MISCDNHEEPIKMTMQKDAKNVIYTCPNNDKHKNCHNSVSTKKLEAILKLITEKIESEEADGSTINLTGWKSSYDSIDFRIVKHSPSVLEIALVDQRKV